jgi:MFS family permease
MTTTDSVAAGEHHPTAWYAEMDAAERKTFWAATGGWILDAMDVQMYSFAIPSLLIAFNIKNADAGLISTFTLLSSSVGGWLAGALSDRIGRVRTLQITIAWFAVFTFLSGFAQDYYQLFAFRTLMGFGFGGEWSAAAILIAEVIRPQHRGKAVGAMQSGWPVGWGIAALVSTLLFAVLPQDIAWRVLFWFGLTPAFLIFFVRRFVSEPPLYTKTRENLAAAGRAACALPSPIRMIRAHRIDTACFGFDIVGDLCVRSLACWLHRCWRRPCGRRLPGRRPRPIRRGPSASSCPTPPAGSPTSPPALSDRGWAMRWASRSLWKTGPAAAASSP